MNNFFTGAGVALVTPFKDDFSIDFDALKKLIKLQIDGGTDFLVVGIIFEAWRECGGRSNKCARRIRFL